MYSKEETGQTGEGGQSTSSTNSSTRSIAVRDAKPLTAKKKEEEDYQESNERVCSYSLIWIYQIPLFADSLLNSLKLILAVSLLDKLLLVLAVSLLNNLPTS